jgi:hypothetical protein
MATTSSMFMYSLTVQPPTAITQAILGQFAGTKEQQIVTASGSRLTLHRPDPSQGKIITALSHDVFGIIRAIAAFRLAGSNKGKSSVLSYWASLSDWSMMAAREIPSWVVTGSEGYISWEFLKNLAK